MKKLNITEEVAEFFFQQCMGTYEGHMAAVPNNPVLKSLCESHGVRTRNDFVLMLKELHEKLDSYSF